MRPIKIVPIILLTGLVIAACGSRTPLNGSSPTPTVTLTSEVASAQGSSGSSGENDVDPGSDEPGESNPADDGAMNASCLVGTWSVDHESLISYLEEQANISNQVEIEFRTGSGDMLLTFENSGQTSFEVNNLEILTTIVGLADFTFILEGGGAASYAADEEFIATWDHVQALESEGGGNVGGLSTEAEAVLLFTPELLYMQGSGDNLTIIVIGAPDDAPVTKYMCSGDSLILNPAGPQTTHWTRVR